MFSKVDSDIDFTTKVEHHIRLTNDYPIKQPDRKIAPALFHELKQILQDWLDKGIIQESDIVPMLFS